jgi:hypothetical protein
MTGLRRETAARERWRIYGGFLPETQDRYWGLCFGVALVYRQTL